MSVLLNIIADRNIRTNLQSRLVTRPNFGAPIIFESKALDFQMTAEFFQELLLEFQLCLLH